MLKLVISYWSTNTNSGSLADTGWVRKMQNIKAMPKHHFKFLRIAPPPKIFYVWGFKALRCIARDSTPGPSGHPLPRKGASGRALAPFLGRGWPEGPGVGFY